MHLGPGVILGKSGDDTKLEGAVESLKGRETSINQRHGQSPTMGSLARALLDSAPGTRHPWLCAQTGE